MDRTPDQLWLDFEALANSYPQDDGVRLTAYLAKWLVEERQRAQLPVPAALHKVVQTVVKAVELPGAPPGGPSAAAGA
jgi:hypothetical protein